MKNLKFATKLLLVILSTSLASVIVVSTISYTELLNLSEYSQDANIRLGFYASDNSKDALIEQAESYMERLSASQAAECDATLAKIQSEVILMAAFMSELYANPGNFAGRVMPLPNEVPADIPTAKMMTAPDVIITPEIEAEMLLVSNAEYIFGNIHAGNHNLSNAYMGSVTGINLRWSVSATYNPDFDPRTRPWYQEAFASDEAVWLEAHIDAFNNIITTCAKAYANPGGEVVGVAATDIRLSTMVENILDMRIGETGYAFLIDENGSYLAHPYYGVTGESDGEEAPSGENYLLLIQSMTEGNSGVSRSEIDGVEYYIAYAPVPTTGWALGIAVEYDEIISGALMMKADIDSQAVEVKDQIRETLNSVMFRFIVLTCIIIIIVLILSILISGSVTKPMLKLTSNVIEIGKGNLDNKTDIETRDEIGVLAACFNKMTDDLTEYIANLSRVTAEKERIGAELDVATKIQASMLPSIFPAFPEREEFDIYASMQPAKEVGGDFYDFFMINENTLAIVMADVSGKGVPAALFMVIAKTLIKNNAQYGQTPKEVFETVNNLLCEGNDAGMFVTAVMGYLDISTGKFTFVNAGHNPPLVKKSGGDFEWLKTKPGFILAGMEDMFYAQHEIILDGGDELFLYTDGVTEAVNNENDLFGDPKLLETANNHHGLPLKEFTVTIKREIDKFAEGAEQADDITMLALRYRGEGGES
ncbi:MAG: SpoIIE family protein phosphatase [Oscillospiraceae bacterium]|nr:SpoIIE family protein phosphatase [Oscillospiraceae bacterium]